MNKFEDDARRFYLALSSIKAYLEYCTENKIEVDNYYLIDYIMKKLYNVKEGK